MLKLNSLTTVYVLCLLLVGNAVFASAGSCESTAFGADVKPGHDQNLIAESSTSAKSNADASKLLLQGKKLLNDGRNDEAEPVLKAAMIADESNADCRLNYGICLYNLGRYWGALSQLGRT